MTVRGEEDRVGFVVVGDIQRGVPVLRVLVPSLDLTAKTCALGDEAKRLAIDIRSRRSGAGDLRRRRNEGPRFGERFLERI